MTVTAGRIIGLALIAVIVWMLASWAPTTASGDAGTTTPLTSTLPATETVTVQAPTPPAIVIASYAGRTAQQWRHAYLVERGRAHALRRTLLHTPTVVEALNLACAVYGNCATIWRRARCESRLDPGAVHDSRRYLLSADSAAGLLQFKPSTWRTTPFAHFSIFSPYAAALAAGWMNSHGRGGEWSCR